jgi:hypothetical protein
MKSLLYALLLFTLSCTSQGQQPLVGNRINGVCLVAPSQPLVPDDLQPVKELGAGWVAVVPYAFSYGGNDPRINYDTSRQWWGERKAGVITTIEYAQAAGLKVMLKPHVWVRGQGWPGDFTLDSEAKWQQWEQSYADYLRTITHVADSLHVEMLCIGTEYRHAVVERPDFWRRLIAEIRQSYSGELTYAANWDNFEQVTFWDKLDYIGIDAYWPLCERETPTPETLAAGWREPLRSIERVQQQYQKPVLFTEYGYESRDHTAQGHWQASEATKTVNLEAQQRAYQTLYDTFWEQPWFAGGFLWKWFPDHAEAGGEAHTGYTPQNKPVMSVIHENYRR